MHVPCEDAGEDASRLYRYRLLADTVTISGHPIATWFPGSYRPGLRPKQYPAVRKNVRIRVRGMSMSDPTNGFYTAQWYGI